jgi:hypothetical protein
MLITKEMIATLKRTNVSKDAEKTKERVKESFFAAKNKVKSQIEDLTGLKRTSIYRVFREGAVSAKVVCAMAQILNVSPFYYTGEADEKGECTDALLHSFLIQKGFREQAYQIAPDRKPRKTEAKEDAPASDEQSKPVPASLGGSMLFSSEFSNSPELAQAAAGLPLDDAIQLLSALYIRAKAGGNPAQLADFIKRCLLM